MTNTAIAIRSLSECEAVIERGLASFVEVGGAFLEIRDAELYREAGYGSFDAYRRERWEGHPVLDVGSRQRAHQLMEAAEVSKNFDGDGPRVESQARELAPLKDDPDAMADAMQEATANGKPTAAKVRDAVERRTRGQLSNQSDGRNDWATPQDLFDALNAEFSFDLDVCASDATAKCARYFTPADDGLTREWAGTCFMNPPYGDEIARWVAKASDSATQNGATVVCLVPARVDTGWWWDYCRHGEIRFLRGRLRFDDGANAAPFPSAVVVFDASRTATVKWWER